MSTRSKAVGIARLCVAAALWVATPHTYADDKTPAPAAAISTNQVPDTNAAPAAATPPAPLMLALGQVGLADPLTKAGINIYGYAQAGYFHDFSSPSRGTGPTYIGYNGYKNSVVLDKVSMNVERTVDPTKKQFDVGFRAEGLYGADAKFIHANGMQDSQFGRNQWDLLQAYVDMAFPGVPLKLRVGKWIELAGFEHYSANIYGAFGDPARALYSYSYSFLYAEPGTQSGAYLTWVANPQWTFDAGFTRGWNQSTRDANHSPDFLGRVTYMPNDKTTIIFVMTAGPEFPFGTGANQAAGDDSHWWTALDLVITYKATDQLSLGLGFDYVEVPKIPGLTGTDKQWGAADAYISYAIDSRFTLNTRLEWYNDSSAGFATGAPRSANYWAITQGVAIKPFPNDKVLSHLLFRPEVRYDYSDQPVFATRDHGELTVSMDALFTF